jgi:hypothetical protein
MARPERNNVDYFPFYCEDGKKMYYLEETYGNDGFATFIKILRELAKTDYHYLDLSKKQTMMFLSAKCKIDYKILDAIIKDLVDLEKFDAVLWNENKIIWCQDFIDSIQDAYIKRKNKCISYDGLLHLLISLGVRKPSKSITKDTVNPQRKEKNTKEDKSKEINNGEKVFSPDVINFYDSVINMFPELYKPKDKINKKNWLDVIDKLNKIDKYEFDLLYKIIYYARHNDFWINNFKSIMKLRKKNKDGISYVDYFKDIIQPNVSAKSNQIGSRPIIGKTNQISYGN